MCPHMDSLKPFFVSHVLCLEYFNSGHPDAGRTIELAGPTEVRITEKNGASPEILLIQDQ